ncbi:MAG: hypothetical protein US25_C0084G0005 [Candidatus Moranbacteria bacterium GW2011_GWE1_36_7]|nr:MAG: hypothetical protein UR99_C0015G0029 [Candidatus Moranbacteria bacterium GW2011_GWD2_36_12]KKQ06395.1 MAG: hypothetical protein US16_C0018G0029 [Candidatus Moranbacteria bacterium GW2011_GWE2_36_40]KKQ11466.1 MAG: hypothetical protein US25_C0084G0005 [Candidatus Moranbacteria bacterium GW2011_GWE1_36_7]
MNTKEIILTSFFVLVSLFVYAFFPVNGYFQQIFGMTIFFVILPLLFNKIFLKRKLIFFGIDKGNWKQGIIWGAISLLIICLIFFVFSEYFGFLQKYTIPVFITKSFVNFLFYEFVVTVFFVVLYEFYFRGFLQFVFEQKIGYLAIILQAFVFFVLVLSIGGGTIYAFVPYIVCAPFAGFVAYKSRSILYSGLVQFIVLFVLNLTIIKLVK